MALNSFLIGRAVVFTLLVSSSALSVAAAPSLCRTGEQVIYSCAIKGRIASVCASPSFSPTQGYIQYRYGTQARVELAYPAISTAAAGHVFFSSVGYSNGGEAHLRFRNGDYDYVVYDRTIMYDRSPPSGVVVRKGGRMIAHLACLSPDSAIAAPAYDFAPREAFAQDIVPR